MAGKWIDIPSSDGKSFQGYLAVPEAGFGPGIILLQEIFGVNGTMRDVADYYAEEGYAVLVPDLFWRFEPHIELGYGEEDFGKAFGYFQKFDVDQSIRDTADALKVLRARPEQAGKVGALGFCLGGKLAYLTAARTDVDCAVCYYGVGLEQALDEAKAATCPMVFHFAELDKFAPEEARNQIMAAFADRDDVELYVYPGCDHAFAAVERESFDKPASLMAHSRSIALFRKVMGPHYDLSTLWDKHTEYEFATRDVDLTMATMVAEPYVNHIPTMTGGVGYKDLHRFYKNHFIPKTPADTKLIPISRTVGADRVVDEMLFCFTHDIEIDWMLPGIPPTGKYVEIPLVGIIRFRGDKLYNEHIYWDQASVLVQIGVLDPTGLPVAGRETADKLVDESLPSNTLMKNWATSAPR
ncbi:dienelactone hydrolase family protein [Amorphus sp. MBR-141]